MALTDAERQAIFKARKAETIDALAQQNTALMEENTALRAELEAVKKKAHRLEVATLKAQIAATKVSEEQRPKSSSAQGNGAASGQAKRPAKQGK